MLVNDGKLPLWHVYWRALGYLAGERRQVFALCAINLVLAAIAIGEPILLGKVIGAIADKGDITGPLGLWIAAGLFNIVAFLIVARQSDRIAHRNRLQVLVDNYEKVLRLPIGWHQAKGRSHALHSLFRGVDSLSSLWTEFMRQHFSTAIALILLVPTAVVMDLRLSLVLAALGVVYLVTSRFVMRRTEAGQRAVEGHHHDVFSHVADTVSNVPLLQGYGRVAVEANTLRRHATALLDRQYPVLDWWALAAAMNRLSSTLSMVVVLGIGAWLVQRGELHVSEVIAFIGFAGLLIGRLDQIVGFFNQIFDARVRLYEFYAIEDEPEPVEDSDKPALCVGAGSVSFRDVCFSYGSGGRGVEGVSFDVPAGATVAIVGPTGSGKSTLVNLLQRCYATTSGQILIDGQDIGEHSLASVRRAMATVHQETALLNRTIEENIRMGREPAAFDEVEAAARAAGAHDFIVSRDEGYGAVAGDGGSRLSGGERQRLGIARAMLRNAPILILDEATSALDVATEQHVKDALGQLREGRTTFVIAHRLSTIRDADLVVYMEDGRVAEFGGYDELVERDGRFADLLRLSNMLPSQHRELAEPIPFLRAA